MLAWAKSSCNANAKKPLARATTDVLPMALSAFRRGAAVSIIRGVRATCVAQQVAATASLSLSSIAPVFQDPAVENLPFYSQFPLDRQAVQRRNSTYISDLFSAQQACLIPLSASQVLVMNSQDHSSNGSSRNSSSGSAAAPALAPVLLSPAAPVASQLAVSPADAIFLGVDGQGRPFFAAEVKDKDAVLTCAQAAAAAAASGDGGAGMMWRDARLAGQDLSPEDASLLAVASSLAQWHAGNGYSSMDGAPTRPSAAGHARRSQGSKRSVYPRIDPATIMLVTVPRPASLNTTTTSVSTNSSSLTAGHPVAGDWCLLGRKAEWPPGRYSTLAGFLEVGEALESAVAREVHEESGVKVDLSSVTYIASQPWPFPRSLMIGFLASAATPSNPDLLGPLPSPSTTSSAATGHRSSSKAAGGTPAFAPAGYDLLSNEGRKAALSVGLKPEEVDQVLLPRLPVVTTDKTELEDVRWFHRDWVSTALTPGSVLPSAVLPPSMSAPQQQQRTSGGQQQQALQETQPARFHIPGRWSLAYRLINTWLSGHLASTAAAAPVLAPAAGTSQPEVQVGEQPGSTPESGSASNSCARPGWAGDQIPQVAIDTGVFKYVLMRLRDPYDLAETSSSGAGPISKLLVWGDSRAPYHMDVLRKATAMAKQHGLKVDILGGGRIEHYPDQGIVSIYGYSAAFGPAPHEVSAALIRKWFPFYDPACITLSYEGY